MTFHADIRQVVMLCYAILVLLTGTYCTQTEDYSSELTSSGDVCEEFSKICENEFYCAYMFSVPNPQLESCPELNELTSDLRGMNQQIQKHTNKLEEVAIEIETQQRSVEDQYDKIHNQHEEIWTHGDQLDRHWQWIERLQKQVKITNEVISDWQLQIEQMWDHIEEQNWVQELRFQMERQQMILERQQRLMEEQQEALDDQQRLWEREQSTVLSQMQEWMMQHQNDLIESIRLAQQPSSDDPVIQQLWNIIHQLQAENYNQQVNLEKYQQQIVCLEDRYMEMERELGEPNQQTRAVDPVIRPATFCTNRKMNGYFHPYHQMPEFNATQDSPPRDVAHFTIQDVHYIVYVYGKQCEIFVYKNKTFTLRQVIQLESTLQYEYLNHFIEHFEINSKHYLVIGHADEYGHIIYIWVNNMFIQYQLLEAEKKQVKDWTFFSIKNNNRKRYFLAVAVNRELQGNYKSAANSTVYRWNGRLFVRFQDIETAGARTLTSFTIQNDVYLAFGFSYLLDSDEPYDVKPEIYKFSRSTSKFQPFQTLSIPGWSTHMTTFQTQDNFYLIDVKFMDTTGSYEVISPLYNWDPNTQQFHIYQNISSKGSTKACPFKTPDGEQYLVITNAWDDQSSANAQHAMIYQDDGTRFATWQVLQLDLVTTCIAFEADGKTYLVLKKNVYELFP
ncbi:uncharacterized protein LOC144437674 [Glandiceps talaboti]